MTHIFVRTINPKISDPGQQGEQKVLRLISLSELSIQKSQTLANKENRRYYDSYLCQNYPSRKLRPWPTRRIEGTMTLIFVRTIHPKISDPGQQGEYSRRYYDSYLCQNYQSKNLRPWPTRRIEGTTTHIFVRTIHPKILDPGQQGDWKV